MEDEYIFIKGKPIDVFGKDKPTDVLLTTEELLAFLDVIIPNLLFDKVGYVAFYLSGFYANTYGKLDNYPDYLIADNFVINDIYKDDMRSKSLVLQTNFKELWEKVHYANECPIKSKIGTDEDVYNYLEEVAKQTDELSWASLVTTVKDFNIYKLCKLGQIPFITQEHTMLSAKENYDF